MNRKNALTLSVLLIATVLAPLAPLAAADPLPPLGVPVTLQNGGEGPNYDFSQYRGKVFTNVPSGTITQTCAYFQIAGATATVSVKIATDGAAPAYSVVISSTQAGWNCDTTSHPWSSSTLFVYKKVGNAAIGYDDQCPSDSRYSEDSGASWHEDSNCRRRGFKIVLTAEPGVPNILVRQNSDGSVTVYDDKNHNGKVNDGETLATVPRTPNPAVRGDADDGFTVYDDRNGNGRQDTGEETIALVPGSAGNATLPAEAANQTIPGQSTPNVASQSVATPAIERPATCPAQACNAPTVVRGMNVTTPPVDPITGTTPAVPVERTCVPLVACVGPFTVPSRSVGPTPGVGSQSVPVPSQTLPALCSIAGAVCLPPTTVLAPQTVSTPQQGPIGLTPTVTVSLALAPSSASFRPHLGQVGAIGPIWTVVPVPLIGNVPVMLCPQTCPAPVPANVSYHGSVTVRIVVGSTVGQATVPVDIG